MIWISKMDLTTATIKKIWQLCYIHIQYYMRIYYSCFYHTPRFNEVERGLYWYHLVRLSVCGQNPVRSVSSTILIGSISYLHILSSNFRRCVAYNSRFKILKFVILVNFLNLCLWLCLLLTRDPIWPNGMGYHEAVGGILRTQAF